MGKTYPTVNTCGFMGRRCALDSYPECNERFMKGVRPISEPQPSDARELSKWVDRWVGITEKSGGVCRTEKGQWRIYFGIDRQPIPLGGAPLLSPSAPAPSDRSDRSAKPPKETPSDASFDMVFEEPAEEPAEEQAAFHEFALSPKPVDSAPEFDALAAFKELAESYGLYAAIGVAAAAVFAGASVMLRKAVLARASKAGMTPPPLPNDLPAASTDTMRPTLPFDKAALLAKDAEVMQRMIGAHSRLATMRWYQELPIEEKFAAMRRYSAPIEAEPAGARSDGSGLKAMYESVGRERVLTLQHRDGDSVRIRPGDLVDSKRTQTILMELDAAMAQIENLKAIEHESVRRADPRLLARALILEMHMLRSAGLWLHAERSMAEGGSELRGPLPPDWIIKRAAETGWGVDGRGDPLAERAPETPNPKRAPSRPPVPPPLPDQKGFETGKTAGHSTFWAQLITSPWFLEMNEQARSFVTDRQPHIELALHRAYSDGSFRERYFDAERGQIKTEGLRLVLREVLTADGVDPARDMRFKPLVKSKNSNGKKEGSFPKRLRKFLRSGK